MVCKIVLFLTFFLQCCFITMLIILSLALFPIMLLLFNMSSLFSETLQTFRISHFERSESSNARSSSEESERNNEVGISTYTRNSQV